MDSIHQPLPTRLYLISPPKIELDAFEVQLQQALEGGDVGSFQLRLKDADDNTVGAAIARLMPICHARRVAFILNDRPDLAKHYRVDGVHLGQDDLELWPLRTTRDLLGGNCVIGISAHASRDMAIEAADQGADYVAFGAFYPTTSKPMEKLEKYGTPTPEIVQWWTTDTVIPCVAIGGMTPANCAPLVSAGADFIAVITAVWNHKDGPKQGVREFNEAIAAAQKPVASGANPE